jgi:hypothetical protein
MNERILNPETLFLSNCCSCYLPLILLYLSLILSHSRIRQDLDLGSDSVAMSLQSYKLGVKSHMYEHGDGQPNFRDVQKGMGSEDWLQLQCPASGTYAFHGRRDRERFVSKIDTLLSSAFDVHA